MKKRLFVAIDFPPHIKKQIGQLIDKLKNNCREIRWESEQNLHLTLKFLGWTDKQDLIVKGMEEAVCRVKPFWCEPTKIGYFLSPSLIIWLGLEGPENLLKLVERLEEEMEKIGFLKERRLFSSHITLGRRRQVSPVAQWRQIAQGLQ